MNIMNRIRPFALAVTLASLFLFLPFFTALADTTGNSAVGIRNPLNFPTLEAAIAGILGVLIQLGTVILVVFFVYTGFMFVAAQGDPKKLETARSAFKYTVIGAIILLGAQALSKLIENTLKPILN